jgi:hypothetical protein
MHDLILKELQNILLKKEIHQSIQVAYFRHRNLVLTLLEFARPEVWPKHQFGHIYVRLHSDSGASSSHVQFQSSELGSTESADPGVLLQVQQYL